MNKQTANFAILGATPEFAEELSVGQCYLPSWERYVTSFRGIFERQYYTEHGPLVQQLEEKLQQFTGVKHAICVTNESIAFIMLADALRLSGKVIVPALNSVVSAQSLIWAGLEPIFCDVSPDDHHIAINQISALIDKDVGAIMGANLWGGACNQKALSELADTHGIQLYFDSQHAFGCAVDGIEIGNFGRAEVFSFHASNILNATEGGCICTHDDDLAARLRNMRSSAGAGKPVNITKTVNGRMSEAQAAIALMSLEDFSSNQQNNQRLHHLYEKYLEAIPGIDCAKPKGVSTSNFQNLVCTVDEREFGLSADLLNAVLHAENIGVQNCFYPGLHQTFSDGRGSLGFKHHCPITDRLGASCLQLPLGARVSAQAVERICDMLLKIHRASPALRSKLDQFRP